MSSAAQFEANRLNAAASSGPKTPAGKACSSRNHLKFGLFSTHNYVRSEETEEYRKVSKALWKDLNPVDAVEEMLAVEIVRVAWRLHRCAVAEAEDGANPATQAAVDRARASAHASMRRLLTDLRQFQSDRWLRAEVLRDGFDEDYIGIADTHCVIKGLADNERLKAQFLMAPIGIDPINQTVGQPSLVAPALSAAGSDATANRTQAVGQALPPGNHNKVGHPGYGPSECESATAGKRFPGASRPVVAPSANTIRTQPAPATPSRDGVSVRNGAVPAPVPIRDTTPEALSASCTGNLISDAEETGAPSLPLRRSHFQHGNGPTCGEAV